MSSNPLHGLIEQFNQFITAVWKCHYSGTQEAWDQAVQEWQTLTRPFWETHHIPADAQRGLADPALAWCSRNGFRDREHVEAIENATHFITALAMLTTPVALPRIYANKEEAETTWQREGDFLLAAMKNRDALQRLAALTGEEWRADRQLPPAPTGPVEQQPFAGNQSQPQGAPPSGHSGTEGDLLMRDIASTPKNPVERLLTPTQRGIVDEVRRAAETLRSVVANLSLWRIEWGRKVAESLDYGPKVAAAPEDWPFRMHEPNESEREIETALRTLYLHRCLPPSLKYRALDEALSLFPRLAHGAISSKKDKKFLADLDKAMNAAGPHP
jgi:hypothetical protein